MVGVKNCFEVSVLKLSKDWFFRAVVVVHGVLSVIVCMAV